MKIYLAHPINGLTYDEVFSYYNSTKDKLKKYFTIMSPMTGKEELRVETEYKAYGYESPIASNHAIIERDRWMVENSDIIFVDLINSDHVSIGCMMELAWAHQLGKHTVIALQKENIHEHAFVLEAADIRYETYEDAIEYLINLGNSIKE